jgi:predicted Fe-S protein YdhL (DUF1289 family)
MKQLTTEIWGLNFLIKGNRLCFITRTPQGVETHHWVTMTAKMKAAVTQKVEAHLTALEERAKMTPQQIADSYKGNP